MIRQLIVLFFRFIVCCHCRCSWDGSWVYVAIWLLFDFSLYCPFASCFDVILSRSVLGRKEQSEKMKVSSRTATAPAFPLLQMPLLLRAFTEQDVFSLLFGMLCPEAETWTGFSGLSFATTANFSAVGRWSMLSREALYLPLLPCLLECVRNGEVCSQQPELVGWGVRTAAPTHLPEERGESSPHFRQPFRKGSPVLPLPAE